MLPRPLKHLSFKKRPNPSASSLEHSPYVKEWSDGGNRPKPVGHEDLNEHWVGAGHLKVGDKIRQADGTTGVVANVVTLQQTREMFNLTVSEAHTFYVGQDGWLVHNANGVACPTVLKLRAQQLAERNGSSDVTILTTNGGVRYDLTSGAHYNTVLGRDVPTPHSHGLTKNVNPKTGETFLNKSKDPLLDGYPAGISDLRLIDKYLKKNGK